MRIRALFVIVVTAMMLAAACGSSSKSTSKTTTTSGGKNFHVNTPNGQVSLSLTGQLPPNWPATFPVPSGAKPAGSGSLVNGGSGVMIGVYTTSEAPSDVLNFYKTNTSLTVKSSKSAGKGNAFVGSVQLGGAYDGGSVKVLAVSQSTYIVIVLKPSSSTATTT
jgi:hypothetical protein